MVYLLSSKNHCVVPGCFFFDRFCNMSDESGGESSDFLKVSNSCFAQSHLVFGFTDVLSSCSSCRMSVCPCASSFAVEAKVLMLSRLIFRDR